MRGAGRGWFVACNRSGRFAVCDSRGLHLLRSGRVVVGSSKRRGVFGSVVRSAVAPAFLRGRVVVRLVRSLVFRFSLIYRHLRLLLPIIGIIVSFAGCIILAVYCALNAVLSTPAERSARGGGQFF